MNNHTSCPGAVIESLEGRALFSISYSVTYLDSGHHIMQVDCTNNSDTPSVRAQGMGAVVISDGTNTQTFGTGANPAITNVQLNALGGGDNISIQYDTGVTQSSITVDVNGGDGSDTITRYDVGGTDHGDDGQDTINIHAVPYATVFGDADEDQIYFFQGATGMAANGGDGDDTIDASALTLDSIRANGDAGSDTIYGSNSTYGSGDLLNGGDDDDWIEGNAGNDELHGNDGDDTLLGGAGGDYISGEAGADYMDGNDGDDWVDAFDGLADSCFGGNGTYTLQADRTFATETIISGFETVSYI